MMVQEMELRKRAEMETNRLQAELRQTEKLRSLGVLAGGVAHDFNNLLVGVLGNAELARAELGAESRIQPYLAEISAAARCAADLTRQMLDYSGKGRFLAEPVNLGNIAKEMASFLRASIPRNVRLELNFPENLPAIEADATQVRQIIMNLAINAAEAVGKQQGTVVLTAGVEQVDGSPPATEYWYGGRSKAEYVFLSVTDPGPGLDPETRTRIFEPFFSTKFTGRGLGLAAVLGILRGHRGGIRVESNPGIGTTFTVWFLSGGQAPLRRREPAVEGKPIHGAGTVLVVDDEPAVRTLIQRILERRGFSVLAAEDGVKALDVFGSQRERIVLVVLDLTMPKLSGQETLEKLLAMQPGLPTILTSGYTQEDISKRLALRQTSFLQKPFTPAELLNVVVGALEERGSSSAGSH
jgi:nitrogen-specific signal transduction histidine kinase/CheY-like chemotaxis protein